MKRLTGILLFLLLQGTFLPVQQTFGQKYYDTTYNVPDTETKGDDEYMESPDSGYVDAGEPADTIVNELISYKPFALNSDSITALKNDKDFYYMAYLDSLLKAERQVVRKPETKSRSISFWNLDFVKYAFWAIAIAIVGFVLYKLFLQNGSLFRTNKKQRLPDLETNDDIVAEDIESHLQRAIKNGNFRLATRYQFLKTLSALGDKGVLQLSSDKTNYQYASELRQKSYANLFARISLQYEYVWFGKFDINAEQYAGIQQQHQEFLRQI